MKLRFVALAVILSLCAFAQSPLKFDVASVKPHPADAADGPHSDLSEPGRIVFTAFSLRTIVAFAYGDSVSIHSLSDAGDKIVGLPTWADTDRFDIDAHAAGNPDQSEKRQMLRVLLAERFKLVAHTESRTRPVFALQTLGQGILGPQLKHHAEGSPCDAATVGGPATVDPAAAAVAALREHSCGQIVGSLLPGDSGLAWSGGRNVTMQQIADAVGGMDPFDRPVVDQTGLTGTFDFTIEWLPGGNDPTPGASQAALITAFRDQLAIRFAATTAPVSVLVVSHAEKPTAN